MPGAKRGAAVGGVPNILEKIAAVSRRRVVVAAAAWPLAELERQVERAWDCDPAFLGRPPVPSFAEALAVPGISFICEVKQASPSKGQIVEEFDHLAIARAYEEAGAAAISVLTEPEFFGGSFDYLREIADAVAVPTLCKDFVVDRYQIAQARLAGARAVLLICALLSDQELAGFIGYAADLGLDALVEAHDAEEVRRAVQAGARIVGVNNRDLRSFAVDLETSLRLRGLVPTGTLFVSESGVTSACDIARLSEAKVDAVLIGEAMMRAGDKRAFLDDLRGGSAAAGGGSAGAAGSEVRT